MHRMLLFLAYFLMITPAGFLCRLIRDPLHRQPDRRAASYWTLLADQDPPGGRAAVLERDQP